MLSKFWIGIVASLVIALGSTSFFLYRTIQSNAQLKDAWATEAANVELLQQNYENLGIAMAERDNTLRSAQKELDRTKGVLNEVQDACLGASAPAAFVERLH